MKTEKALELLKQYQYYGSDFLSAPYNEAEHNEAIKIAIEALEEKLPSEIVPIGTKVRVIYNYSEHEHYIGEIVKITTYDKNFDTYQVNNYYWLTREEFEIIDQNNEQ